jgi:hypothetical protein
MTNFALTREFLENAIQDLAIDLHTWSEKSGELGWRGMAGKVLLAILEERYGQHGRVRSLITPNEALALFQHLVEDLDWRAVQQELLRNGETAAASARAKRRLDYVATLETGHVRLMRRFEVERGNKP